ncbi:hypothetical protein EDC36_104210 [Tepidimonas ignava]|jgi:DNA-binding MarR family transcriptional regulator|uniref:Uncharacterized protein n=1 Tax=Tepidimonas ignava TaxID=114249 RepID=A0A4R3LLU5_9BURK|nr:hypothetical protein [Tepidimonas ignava]TCS98786.1 hypothetical protein EDC36_104210 [Tepidimonas ignava]TSE20289.1 hypothetical protein Tigna_01920 [Tepidimonas ignava]
MQAGTFALIPIEVIQDRRLTYEQVRVLMALFCLRGGGFGVTPASAHDIASLVGMPMDDVTRILRDLAGLGCLRKYGFALDEVEAK